MEQSPRTPGADIFALCCALAVLIAFVALPVVSFPGLSFTAFTLLTTVDSSGNHIDGWGWLLLFVLVAICALITAFWGLRSPSSRRTASVATAVAGLVLLAPLAYGLAQLLQYSTSANGINVMGLVGAGCWIAFIASIGLIVQVFLRRPVVAASGSSWNAPPPWSSTPPPWSGTAPRPEQPAGPTPAAMQACRQCRGHLMPGEPFCPHCGGRVTE